MKKDPLKKRFFEKGRIISGIDMNKKVDVFENYPVPKALAVMALPTIISQLITLSQTILSEGQSL